MGRTCRTVAVGLVFAAMLMVAPGTAQEDGDGTDIAYSKEIILPPDYDTFTPPAEVGGTYADPIFGTVVTRMTVHPADRRTMAEVTNSEISYFNYDGSIFIAGSEMGKGCLYDGRTGAAIKELPGAALRPWNVRWSTDPGKFYQYDANEVRLVNVDDLSATVLHKFDEYTQIGPAGGEGDVDDNCRYWCLDGGGRLFVYDLINDVKGPESPFVFDRSIDYASVTSSGEYVAVLWRTSGTQRYAGTELYDRDWNFVRQLLPWSSHSEFAYDQDHNEILVCAAAFKFDDFTKAAGVNPGDIISVRMSDGKVTRLLEMPKWSHQMYSACNTVTTPQYVYMSLVSRGYNPTETWFPYYGEILEVPTDGSQQIRRLLHHRSREMPGVSQKGTQPDFCINRQGDRIIYKSNYGTPYTDLYMFDVTPRETEEQAPAAPGEQAAAPAGLNPAAINSRGVLVPPEYGTWQPPRDVLASFLDPTFGTHLVRMTVATDAPSGMAEVTNSEISYFNADGTLVAATDERGWGYLYDGVTGAKVKEFGNGTMRPWWMRWSGDPRRFYKYEGNEIRLYNADDLSNEVVQRFGEYTEIGPAGGEGDLSDDRRFWALDGDGRELFVYDLVERKKGPVAPFPFDGKAIDYVAMTCSGDYVLVLWRQTGKERFNGTEVYDRDWNFQRQLAPYCPHLEPAYNGQGEEIIVCAAYHQNEEFLAGSGAQAGDIISIRLSDGKITPLLDMTQWTHQCYSACNSVTTPGYVYASLAGRGMDPSQNWWPYYGEIVEIPTDGSGQVRRLAHTRTDPQHGRFKADIDAKLCVNPQGTRIIFQSNVGQVKPDLYLLDIPPRDQTTPAPAQ